ncbi:MAG: O-antigen ligase family protein [Patescibacteria group bacterium]
MNINGLLRNSIIGLLFLVLVIPLVVSGSMFFPFIAGKGFLFRTIIEIALALYLALVIRDRSYIPRKSAITWSLISFLVVMAVATILSENPFKSFWSNYERMEGYVTMLHLGAYFLVLAGVFTRDLWRSLLNTSLAASVIIGGYAFMSDRFGENILGRIQGTFGNSTYLGVYALLHVFIAAFLALRLVEYRGSFKKSWTPVAIYTLLAIFNTYIMYSTGTRGSFVGLVAGALVTTILIAIFERTRPQMRKIAVGVCIAVVLVIIGLGSAKETPFVQSSPILSRFSSLITLDVASLLENQGHARSLIWGMAWEGFKDRPIFGWGQESFNYVFAEHYNPEMYDQEQWFDRSHNVFFDWMIAGGALGLLSYLSLFVSIIYLIWRKPQHEDESWSVAEKSVLTGLLAAYFVHNIFVFDNLPSYILFFMLLAYVHQRSTVHGTHTKHIPLITSEVTQNVLIGVVGVLVISSLYVGVYVPYMQNIYLINALKANAGVNEQGGALVEAEKGSQILKYLQKAASKNAFGKYEVRERIAELGASVVTNPTNAGEVAEGYEQLLRSEYAKQFTETPNDPRPYMFYGAYLSQTSRTDEAIEAFKKTIELSPNKQQFLLQLAVAYFSNKDFAPALSNAKKAYELDKSNKEALAIYAVILVYAKDVKTADAVIAEGLANGIDVTEDPRFVQALLDTKNFTKLIAFVKQKVAANPNDPQTLVSAAAVYLKAGDRISAIQSLRKAIELEPRFKTQGEEYIRIIQAGGDPSETQN